MSAAVQYAYQHNRLQELDSRTLEEFLISGICFQKIGYGYRRGKTDVWVDEVNPNRIFFNAMEDSRHWDCTLIGELHDMTIAEVISRFCVRVARAGRTAAPHLLPRPTPRPCTPQLREPHDPELSTGSTSTCPLRPSCAGLSRCGSSKVRRY